MGSVITMYGAGAGSAAWENGSQIDVPQNGTLDGVCLSVSTDADADGDTWAMLLSFSSTPGNPGNDSRSAILMYNNQLQLVTSGIGVGLGLIYCPLPEIPVAVGERIFLHYFAANGVTITVYAGLHFSFNQAVPSNRR